jgi:glucokinase-like ROK family protein
MEKATRQQIKEQNRNLVLKTIVECTSTSRAEIARITHLTRTTVSDIVTDLLAEGLVKEIGMGSSMGGKSPILLSLVDDSRYLLALDLAYNQFSGAIVDLRGKIHQFVSLPVTDTGNDKALQAAYEIIDQLLDRSYQPIVGMGVGAPGLVNTRDGLVIQAVNLDWVDLPLGQLLQARYHLPVYVLNDCQAAAMGEYRFGNLPSAEQNMVVVRVGHGIGAGIIINGHIFQGDGGSAGEIGHIKIVREGGLPCRCGHAGCLETVASARSILQRTRQLGGELNDVTLASISQEFHAGEPQIKQIVLEAGRSLGSVIASLISTLNIHDIVITGDMVCFGPLWLNAIQDAFSQATLSRLAKETTVRFGSLADNGVILGASALMSNNYALLFQRQ